MLASIAINQLKREGQYNSKVQYDICLGVLRIQTLQNKVIIFIFVDIVCNVSVICTQTTFERTKI